MLLRMLSACAPCIGYWINPTACSGQDQDPSNETIVGSDQSVAHVSFVGAASCLLEARISMLHWSLIGIQVETSTMAQPPQGLSKQIGRGGIIVMFGLELGVDR